MSPRPSIAAWALLGAWLLAGCPSPPPTPPTAAPTALTLVAPPPSPAPSASAVASASSAPTKEPPPEPEEPGRDEGPLVSKSGNAKAWIKAGRELFVQAGGGEARRVAGPEPLQVANDWTNLPNLDAKGMGGLAFSPDERRVYFMKPGWETSLALFYAEIASGKLFFFHDANDYRVIETCTDRAQIGRIITFEHSYFDLSPLSAVDAYFLVDGAEPGHSQPRTGAAGRVGVIGFGAENLARFLYKRCGVGKAPPTPKPMSVPRALQGKTVKCGDATFNRDDLRLLDGTVEVRFREARTDGGPGFLLDLEAMVSSCEGAAPPPVTAGSRRP